MTSSAAAALTDLAAINLRSRSAVSAALPAARQAAALVREALQRGENPLQQLDATTAQRACSFAVSLCESALVNAASSDLEAALWLTAALEPQGEMQHTLHFTAAVLQSTRLRLGLAFAAVSAALAPLSAAPAWDFLMNFLAADDDPERILGAYAISLVDDEKGLRFKQTR